MSITPQEEPAAPVAEQQKNEKEYNFAQIRKKLESEEREKAKIAQELAQLKAQLTRSIPADEEDSYDEPYIDRKYLKKSLSKNSEQIKEEARREAREEMQRMFQEEKKNSWLKTNADFQEVMQHAQKFAELDPELAETILEMPEGFERQKLVYKNIKALGLHKPAEKKPSVQDKIDQNRRGVFYQPSGQGAAPYGSNGDFSSTGQKTAYDHMKALQQRLRLG